MKEKFTAHQLTTHNSEHIKHDPHKLNPLNNKAYMRYYQDLKYIWSSALNAIILVNSGNMHHLMLSLNICIFSNHVLSLCLMHIIFTCIKYKLKNYITTALANSSHFNQLQPTVAAIIIKIIITELNITQLSIAQLNMAQFKKVDSK